MAEEAAAQGLDGLFHAIAEAVEDSRAFAERGVVPTFKPAVLDGLAFGDLNAGLMAQEEQEEEVAVDLAFHHRLKIELDAGGAGERGVVAEQPKPKAVGDEAPKMVVAATQKLLDKAVGTDARSAAGTGRAPVQFLSERDKVDGRSLPDVADGIALAVDLDGPGGLEPAVAKFLEEDEQPAFARECRAGV
ncbi:MAG TPA: hypothetical protein PKL76_20725 [Phycisphaerae bacterium]|nr:hypothetical protein [Phycisphaerae bacterium]